MTRFPHDQFSKQYLAELLAPLGKVQIGREVTDETRQLMFGLNVHHTPLPIVKG